MFEKITPKQKRLLVWCVGIVILVLIVMLVNPADKAKNRREDNVVKHVLTDMNTREIGVDSIAANLKLVHEREEKLDRELQSMRRELELIRKNAGLLKVNGLNDTDLNIKLKEMQDLISEFRMIKTMLPKNIAQQQKDNNANSSRLIPTNDNTKSNDGTLVNCPNGNCAKEQSKIIIRSLSYDDHVSNSKENNNLLTQDSFVLNKTINKKADNNNNASTNLVNKKNINTVNEKDRAYIPAGTILSGMLITGLDAPTQENAKNEPFPVLININKEALLPNEFTLNLRECFVIAAGFGDMSSERVYLRAENISCITKSGRAVEVKLSAYATGEDGKAGLRGRLVSKQGKLIARSLLAGFLEGLSGAFDVNPVPVISTSSSDQTQYQSVYNNKALQGAAVAGSSKALERIASFYLKLAQDMFPVLEIDAARKIDLIITQGFTLDLNEQELE
jgi:conjugal transfer pilus assembly protein TraB